jgi:hypothetical protein
MRFVAANDDKGMTSQSNLDDFEAYLNANPKRGDQEAFYDNNSSACETEIQTTIKSLKKNPCPLRALLWGL